MSISSASNLEGPVCVEHPLHVVSWVCFDPSCLKENPKCCVICIKNKHAKCKDHFLIEPNQFQSKVHFIKSDFESSKLVQAVSSTLYDHIGNFNNSLSLKQDSFIGTLQFDAKSASLNAQSVASMKKNLKIVHNKETSVIDISSKLEITDENYHESIENFNKKLEKLFEKFTEEFGKIKFVSIGGNCRLIPEDWQSNPFISVDEDGPCLSFSRKPEMGAMDYYCVVNNVPLPDNCTFKLTIQGICETDRFLDFGIVDKEKFDSIVNGAYMNSFSSGGISYCGYSFGGGLNGTVVTSSSNDASGFKPGDFVYLDYNKGGEIKFHNESLTTNLVMSGLSPEKDYYLFLVLYHKEAIGLLERMS